MKNLISIFLSMIILLQVSYAQEESIVEKMDIMFTFDQVRLRVDKKIDEKIRLRTTVKLKKDEHRIYEGLVFRIENGISTSINIGFKQFYSDKTLCTIYGDFRGNFDWGIVRINYGTIDWSEYNVSTSVIRYFGKNIGVGIASGNEYIGPRFEYILDMKKVSIRLHLSYTDKINYGVKINI